MSYRSPEELRARVLAATQHRPSLTRAAVERRRKVLLSLAALPPLLAAVNARPWAIEWPLPKLLALVASSGAVVAGLSWLGRAGPDALRRPRGALLVFALGAPSLFFALIALSLHADQGDHGPLFHLGPCLGMTLGFAAAPLALGLYLARGGDPVHPRSLGAAFGATAAALSSVAATTICAVVEQSHLLVAHAAPFALLVAAGALLGGRWLPLHPREP